MNRSQRPFLIALAAILLILVIANELGRRPATRPSPPPSIRREYANPALGFSLQLPEGWTLTDSLAAEKKALQASLEIVQLATGGRVILRASATPWEFFVPLAKTRNELREPVIIDERQGWSAPAGRAMSYAACEGAHALLELFGPTALLDSTIPWLRWTSNDGPERGRVIFERPSTLPDRVRRWRQQCQALDLTAFGSLLVEGNGSYVYVGSGQRPTGGYLCTISTIVRAGNDRIAVFADFVRPRVGEIVTQAYSSPSDVVLIDGTGYVAHFFGDGNDAPPAVSHLVGIDSLPPVFDQSRTIKVFSPAPTSLVEGTVRVSGLVHGTVERLFSRLLDSSEAVIDAKSSAREPSPHWFAFTDTLALAPHAEGTTVHLELYTIDDASDDIVDQIRIPLRVKKP